MFNCITQRLACGIGLQRDIADTELSSEHVHEVSRSRVDAVPEAKWRVPLWRLDSSRETHACATLTGLPLRLHRHRRPPYHLVLLLPPSPSFLIFLPAVKILRKQSPATFPSVISSRTRSFTLSITA